MKEELTQSDFTKKLYKEVEKARENKEWRREYMAWISELEEAKEEAREEARKAVREEMAISMLRDNMPIGSVKKFVSMGKNTSFLVRISI